VARIDRPLVIDGDALTLLGRDAPGLLATRSQPTVLTPHDREFADVSGAAPAVDRIAAVRELARRANCVVLLKGPATIVADAAGNVLVSTTGDARLATAGTGDVLAGLVGALLARGLAPLRAAAAAAFAHGRAAQCAPPEGMIAGDLLVHLPTVLSSLRGG
jgi:hydroxyethylthiazole kinase-like uncharacterized protein yjeF